MYLIPLSNLQDIQGYIRTTLKMKKNLIQVQNTRHCQVGKGQKEDFGIKAYIMQQCSQAYLSDTFSLLGR